MKIKIKSFECLKSIRNYEKNNAWNIRRLVTWSLGQTNQRTSVLYYRLTNFRSRVCPTRSHYHTEQYSNTHWQLQGVGLVCIMKYLLKLCILFPYSSLLTFIKFDVPRNDEFTWLKVIHQEQQLRILEAYGFKTIFLLVSFLIQPQFGAFKKNLFI